MDTPLRPSLGQYINSIQARAAETLAAAGRQFHSGPPEVRTLIRRLAAGIALLIFSLLLGITAHEQTARNTLKTWETQNPPSGALWSGILKSQEFTEIPDGTRKNSLIRHHPARWDQPGEAWRASSGKQDSPHWIAILLADKDSATPELRVFERLRCPVPALNHNEETTRNHPKRNRRKKAAPLLISSETGNTAELKQAPLPSPMDWVPIGLGWAALKTWSESQDSTSTVSDCTHTQFPPSRRGQISPRNSDPRAFRY